MKKVKERSDVASIFEQNSRFFEQIMGILFIEVDVRNKVIHLLAC